MFTPPAGDAAFENFTIAPSHLIDVFKEKFLPVKENQATATLQSSSPSELPNNSSNNTTAEDAATVNDGGEGGARDLQLQVITLLLPLMSRKHSPAAY